MKYVVSVSDSQANVSLSFKSGSVWLDVGTGGSYMTVAEFKEFRKAVGYVWQEVENHNG